MKKLSKIKLHDAIEMTDSEMKKVVGGWDGSGTGNLDGHSGLISTTSCSRDCVIERDENGNPTKTQSESITCPGDCVYDETETKCVYNGQVWGRIGCATS